MRWSANLRSLAEPGPLLGRDITGLEAILVAGLEAILVYSYITVSYPTCAQLCLERGRNTSKLFFHACAGAGAPWASAHRSLYIISHQKLLLEDVIVTHRRRKVVG